MLIFIGWGLIPIDLILDCVPIQKNNAGGYVRRDLQGVRCSSRKMGGDGWRWAKILAFSGVIRSSTLKFGSVQLLARANSISTALGRLFRG